MKKVSVLIDIFSAVIMFADEVIPKLHESMHQQYTVGQGGSVKEKFSKYFLILHWDIFFSKMIGTSRFTL